MVEIKEGSQELEAFLSSWSYDVRGAKKAFRSLRELLESLDNAVLIFHQRPGVSYSLRAAFRAGGDRSVALFALVDIIEDPSERWLSVCFYDRMITDPMELGETVPKGLLGEDGYCFHVTGFDEVLIAYLKERIIEAYRFSLEHHEL